MDDTENQAEPRDWDQIQELDNMLGSLTLELEELVQEVNGSETSTQVIKVPRRRIAKTEFLRPTSTTGTPQVSGDIGDISGSDDEEAADDATEELLNIMKSVDSSSLLSAAGRESDETQSKAAAAVDKGRLQSSAADEDDNNIYVTCDINDFLGEDNGLQESDDEPDLDDPEESTMTEPNAELGEGGGYWASVGSFASAGWGLAANSLAKATELSKSSIEATKQSLAGKVYSLKSDPALVALCEQRYLELSREPKAVEIIVTSGQTARVPFNIPKGFSLAWRVRVKEYDVGFGVRERKQAKGGAIDEHIEDMRKIRSTDDTVSGGIGESDRSRQIVLVFDNSYSKLRPKSCIYAVHCGKGVYVIPHLDTVAEIVNSVHQNYRDNGNISSHQHDLVEATNEGERLV